MVIAARQPLFQQHVEDHEQIAAAHLLDAQLGMTLLASVPVCRDDGVRVPADDGLQRELDRQVEVLDRIG
jgi:hypothetical protein